MNSIITYTEDNDKQKILQQVTAEIPQDSPILQNTKLEDKIPLAKINLAQLKEKSKINKKMVYVSKFSPFCKLCRRSFACYFFILLLSVAFLILNMYYIGLAPEVYQIRIRNDSTLRSYEVPSGTQLNQLLYSNITDSITISSFPQQIWLKNTAGIKKLTKLTFTQSLNDFQILIDNPQRQRISLNRPWFNFAHWVDFAFKPIAQNTTNICKPVYRVNSTKLYVQNDESTNVPLYVLDLASLAQIQDYQLELKLNDFTCFSPLVVDQADEVAFSNMQITSTIALSTPKIKLDNCSINQIQLYESTNITIHNCTIKFLLSKESTYYGISGFKLNELGEKQYYRDQISLNGSGIIDIQIVNENYISKTLVNFGNGTHKITIDEDVSYITIENEPGVTFQLK